MAALVNVGQRALGAGGCVVEHVPHEHGPSRCDSWRSFAAERDAVANPLLGSRGWAQAMPCCKERGCHAHGFYQQLGASP